LSAMGCCCWENAVTARDAVSRGYMKDRYRILVSGLL
jgi:hypothetical protein